MTSGTSSNLPVPSDTAETGAVFSGRKAHRVLVIDDSPEIRLVIEEVLVMFGHHAILAEDGMSGVKAAIEHLPDLIICDIRMPGMDGYETLKRLRSEQATVAIPFMFLSGATDRVTIRKGMELGADDYLTKPFSPKELMAAVSARIEKQAEVKRAADKQLNELRGNLTMALPHELRTPLNGIMGLSHLMMDDYAQMPPDEVLESARFIHESALRLHRLIENFLVYSQIELMGATSQLPETPDGRRSVAIQDVVPELARKIAAHHKREGDLLLRTESALILVSTEHFTKIVEELVDNAFKFSQPGRPVLVASEVVNGRFCLIVADKGRGMSSEHVARIGPHVQFERGTFEQQGSGLGLFLAKRITELLGGLFLIDSKVDEGTTLRVSFALPDI